MNAVNRQMTLRRYPDGMPKESDFEVITATLPDVGEGQVLCRAHYLTVDPYIRVHISPSMSVGYAPTTPLGSPIPGEASSGRPVLSASSTVTDRATSSSTCSVGTTCPEAARPRVRPRPSA